jgi:hypothetical protein
VDRVDQLTHRLLHDLEREASDHPLTASEAHLAECLACLNRRVELRDDLHAIAAAEAVSPRLARRLEELLGNEPPETLRMRAMARVRRALVVRVPVWAVAGMAAALVALTWVTTQHVYRPAVGVEWPVPDPTRPDPLTPAHRQGARTVSGVVSAIRDATSNGVEAHVLDLKDASGATYVLFTWGRPRVKPGDAVEIEALFTGVASGTGPPVYQGVVTELRRAR